MQLHTNPKRNFSGNFPLNLYPTLKRLRRTIAYLLRTGGILRNDRSNARTDDDSPFFLGQGAARSAHKRTCTTCRFDCRMLQQPATRQPFLHPPISSVRSAGRFKYLVPLSLIRNRVTLRITSFGTIIEQLYASLFLLFTFENSRIQTDFLG